MKTQATIEFLEARIAPAAVFHYTDVDGDKVTITSSKGANFDLMNAAHVVGGQLQTLDLSAAMFGSEFDQTSITISAVRAPGGTGDGKVNVGYLNATGRDLGAVKIGGDLGCIDVGDGNAAAPALASLTVGSIYRFGKSTQDANGSVTSTIKGRIGALTTTGDVLGVLNVVGGADGRIGPISIGGSLMADVSVPDSHGFINTDGDIGAVKVKGSLFGGGFNSGGGAVITAGGKIASITVGGSIAGQYTGGGRSGGILATGDIGPVKVVHDVQSTSFAGSGDSGFIRSDAGKIASLSIGGSLIGGGDNISGAVFGKTGVGNVTIVGEVLRGSVVSGAGMGTVSIGGSLTGGASSATGLIRSAQAMGAVKIGGDIGGGFFDAGQVDGGTVASVTVHGSVIGGPGSLTGVISATAKLGPVKIGHNVVGGGGVLSGAIGSGGNVVSVTIGGSVYGGSADSSGRISASGDLGPVKIAGDLKASYVIGSGTVVAEGNIASVTIGGSVSTVGTNATSGALSGSIRSGATIGSIVIRGSVTGSSYGTAILSAKNEIKSVSIGGSLDYGKILAGYDTSLAVANADAQIGPVRIGGNLIASSIVAGSLNLGADGAFGGSLLNADNVNYGDLHDAGIGGGKAGVIAKIASITIGGQVIGTLNNLNNTDSFGFVAEQIGAVKIGGNLAALTVGAHNDNLALGQTADFHIHEI